MLHPWRKRTCTFVPHAMHALQRVYRDGNERARAFLTRALARYNTRMAASVADKQAAGRPTAEWFLPSTPHRLLLRRLALRAMALPGLDRLLSSRIVAGAGGIP